MRLEAEVDALASLTALPLRDGSVDVIATDHAPHTIAYEGLI